MKASEMIAELELELKMRDHVFPRWVRSGKLKQATADKRINAMREALRIVKQHFTKQQKLF